MKLHGLSNRSHFWLLDNKYTTEKQGRLKEALLDLATSIIHHMNKHGGTKWERSIKNMEGKRSIPNINFSYDYKRFEEAAKITSAKEQYAKALEVLEVDETTNKTQIKAAYRRLALAYHPDKNGGNDRAKEKFQEIVNAYQFIKEKNNWE